MTLVSSEVPFVSIIIPCRNEKKFIGNCLDSILNNGYPSERLKVIVVDGMSEDGTREILHSYMERYSNLRVLDNPRKITPVALNTGIKAAKGDILIRMDVHSRYPNGYIALCCQLLSNLDVDVVGGPVITTASEDTLIARGIALVTSHPFGVGNSQFRTSAKAGLVDTVPFGAYKKEVFDRIGLFNEALERNQDNEFSSRVLKSGGKIYMHPDLGVPYFNQSTWGGLLKQALKTGMWNVATLKINPEAFRWRHFIPCFFVGMLITLSILSLLNLVFQYALIGVLSLYGVAAFLSAAQIGIKQGIMHLFTLPLIFFSYHVCYGLGSWAGLSKMLTGGWENLSPTVGNK